MSRIVSLAYLAENAYLCTVAGQGQRNTFAYQPLNHRSLNAGWHENVPPMLDSK